MIMERFDESLVLLQDLLCWSPTDLAYLKQNQRKSTAKTNITAETRKIMKSWLWADYKLYDFFKKKFDSKVNEFDSAKLATKLHSLQRANDKLRKECVKERISI